MQLTLIFIGINVIMFILQQLGMFSNMAFTPATFISQPYTIVTAMFMHASLQHLMLNMLGLFMFGSVVEKEVGRLRWLIIYMFAGISGSLAYMLFGNSIFIPALGASGAIFGLMGSAAVLKPRMIIWTSYGPFPMIIAAIGWGLAEFAGMFGVDTIARSAHVGGILAGALIALFVIRKIDTKLLALSIILPILASIFVGYSLPHEIPAYNDIPRGFELNDSLHRIGFRMDVYKKDSDYIVAITSPASDKFNLAIYSRYLESTVSDIYPLIFNTDCNETPDYTIDTNNETAIITGKLCSQNFYAIAANCPKNIDVRVVEFYTDQPSLNDFVSCKGLSS